MVFIDVVFFSIEFAGMFLFIKYDVIDVDLWRLNLFFVIGGGLCGVIDFESRIRGLAFVVAFAYVVVA